MCTILRMVQPGINLFELMLNFLYYFLQRMENRVFVSFSNSTGMDCKMIGPETLCFCQHR